jgi:hypothetical protein
MEDFKLEADTVCYTNLLHKTSFAHAKTYLDQLKTNKLTAGTLLQNILRSRKIDLLTVTQFIECLLNTKKHKYLPKAAYWVMVLIGILLSLLCSAIFLWLWKSTFLTMLCTTPLLYIHRPLKPC